MPEKNARGYVQDTSSALNQAKSLLENAKDTVEKQGNREDIEESLRMVDQALQQSNTAANNLEKH
ncbi:hypothetical protein [Peribacillus deserti]|uniref:Uncharacterized protein n=1 Tax=Peribacillus deserti TaxID=673318 RepID=A0A2N5M6F6_9BACI|nr:hypothetical protein [Peribacillus deserti]PLT29939.1 hypothetical protein CUU66_10450 [Peribacillus deserti]